LIQTFTADEWEDFIEEWTDGFNPPYHQVVRLGGAGDMGRDVIGHLADTRPCPCDVYQCKHYDHPLRPSEAYLELGKLCWYTHSKEYPVPQRYRFVPPRSVGPALYNLINYPDKLRAQLIANWDKYCLKGITEKSDTPLVGKLKTCVEAFDFSIVGFLTPKEVIEQHRRTNHFHRRFKVDPPVRPEPDAAPVALHASELRYIASLLDAYTDHLKRPITVDDLAGLPKFAKHFSQARGYFFSAEALARFSRDHFTAGAFDKVKQHVFDGIVDVTMISHADGLACLHEVMKQASAMALPSSDLLPYVWPADRKGICHHLANDGTLAWVPQT
jgi:hypothetical protein